MSAARLYLYAVMRADASPQLDFKPVAAAADGPARVVTTAGLQAVVSDTEADEILPARRHLLGHAKALETLMSAGATLPMRFGMVAPDAERVARTLEAYADTLRGRLDALAGAVEMGVRVDWDRPRAMASLVAERPDLARQRAALAAKGAAARPQMIELGRVVEAALAEKVAREGETLLSRLRPFARDVETTAPETSPEGDVAVLRADLLIDAESEAALAAEMDAIEAEAPDLYRIRLVGPGPAYSFARLKLDWGDTPAPLKRAG